ncbi:hypothetical protein SH1V18_32830 [Vallitalea longa]|uniref:Uncharacterized protein n=1 Tax=Vallitalea longa TaxID=2936439 RepID=A0A9W5YED8_9FIRM|nr:hypothetical protein SH1V18_32830 [Vallitalea longa]
MQQCEREYENIMKYINNNIMLTIYIIHMKTNDYISE